MNSKQISKAILAAAFLTGTTSYADSLLRMATVKVAVYKSSIEKKTGQYTQKIDLVCQKESQIPVIDYTTNEVLEIKDQGAIECLSDFKGQKVSITTTAKLGYDEGNKRLPWTNGVSTKLKGFLAYSIIRPVGQTIIDENLIPRAIFNSNYSMDLSIKELGLTLIPEAHSIFCLFNTCENKDEYFYTELYIEDKAQ